MRNKRFVRFFLFIDDLAKIEMGFETSSDNLKLDHVSEKKNPC